MAKFLTEVHLSEGIVSRFEAESAPEVLAVLGTFGFSPFTTVAVASPPAETEGALADKPARRTRAKKEPGVVGSITPPANPTDAPVVTKVPLAESSPAYPALTSISEIADAIRNYARKPGVGVPGVTKLIQEFKTATGETAKQVKDIAPSEFPAVSMRLGALLA